MSGTYDDEEIALPLLRPSTRRAPLEPEVVDDLPSPGDEADRLRPAASGALAGFFAGPAALGVFHAVLKGVVTGALARAAVARGVSLEASIAVAYATAAAAGALVGTVFASVTRYLRKWLALAIWAVIFFESVTVVILATFPSRLVPFAPAALAAAAVYGIVASFALPIRRR